MRTKKFFAMALVALLTSMTSCKNDERSEVNPTDAQVKSVYIKLENAPKSSTRSDSESGLSTSATLTNGVVVFANADVITRYVTLSATGSPTYSEPTTGDIANIKISEMISNGVSFSNIKADKVYIIGNRTVAQLAGLPAQDPDGKISTTVKMADLIKASATFLDVTNEGDMSNGEHANVALYGTNSLTHDSGDNYKATVTLIPIVARLEIKEIAATNVSFDLSGIFVNNYYTKAQVNGLIPAASTLKNNMSVVANYLENYHANALRDWSDDSLGTKTIESQKLSVKPAKVWGYNIFAAKNVETTDKNLPRIVLRLKNLKDNNGQDINNGLGVPADQFITVTGFNDGSNPIKEFVAGYVYTITQISFDRSNLTEEPEIGDRVINAEVKVEVQQWKDGEEIHPEI